MATTIQRRLMTDIPAEHQTTSDTRIVWLWSQRLANVQSISIRAKSPLDQMAALLVLQATMSRHLPSIELVLRRLEGGAESDEAVVEAL